MEDFEKKNELRRFLDSHFHRFDGFGGNRLVFRAVRFGGSYRPTLNSALEQAAKDAGLMGNSLPQMIKGCNDQTVITALNALALESV